MSCGVVARGRLVGLGGGEQRRTGGVVLVPKARVRHRGPCDGFTLVEAVVAITLIGIGVASTLGALTKFNAIAATEM